MIHWNPSFIRYMALACCFTSLGYSDAFLCDSRRSSSTRRHTPLLLSKTNVPLSENSTVIEEPHLDLEPKPKNNRRKRGDKKVTKKHLKEKVKEVVEVSTSAVQQTAVDDEKKGNPRSARKILGDHPARTFPETGFNVVLTHATADFDSLASAVGLAKLWSIDGAEEASSTDRKFDSPSHVPTFVILPRGTHPGVQRFLALHKHLFPIRSLRALLSSNYISKLHRLALVDAQRRDRLGPAKALLEHADDITVVDHHIDQDSDINPTNYVVEPVGSVSTLITERLKNLDYPVLSEAEATLLALGIHSDTGSLQFDSTTARDAAALAWLLSQGASQTAIAEHAVAGLGIEQQGVLTQALANTNSTLIQGVTVATALLQANGFIHGLAAVTHDALDLSSSDVFVLGMVYQAKSGKKNKKKTERKITQKLRTKTKIRSEAAASILYAEAWKGGEEALRRRKLRSAFDRTDVDRSGYLDENEVAASLASAGVIVQADTVDEVLRLIDQDGNGKIDFQEFMAFAAEAEKYQEERNRLLGHKGTTMIIIGRVKAGYNMKAVKLNNVLEKFGGGGHPKAASATVRLNDESEAEGILQSIVDEIIDTGVTKQPSVRDFMKSPVQTVKPEMTELAITDMFSRFDVRAFPVVDAEHNLLGLVTYQLVEDAKQRLMNKQKRKADSSGAPKGTPAKAWMLQHVQTVEETKTMAEIETILMETDVGCIPVVAEGTRQLVGMVTRTDLLRQHRYYDNLPYHNKGFADSIAARKPIIELRKRLKKFDLD